MIQLTKSTLEVVKQIQHQLPRHALLPDEGFKSTSAHVLPPSVVRGSRGYIESIVNQINGCYERGWFDACAVMIRRLIETLIIEAFERNGIASRIKGPSGDFFYLKDLINATLSEESWNLSRNTRLALPRLKDVGDKSAHSRRFIAHRPDIDKLIDDIRIVSQELIYLAGLK